VVPELSVFELARRQGKPGLVQALIDAGVCENVTDQTVQLHPKPAASVRAAVDRSIVPLQRADVAFLQKAGCVSCHNNSLAAMAIAAARAAGVRVNEHTATDQLHKIAAFLQENRERALENVGLPGSVDTVSHILLGLAAENYPSDTITDVWARYLKVRQSPDGSWKCLTSVRPPLELSDFQVTAASIRALRAYGAPAQRSEYDKAAQRGTRWLDVRSRS
jgi:hypothetical protein